MSDLLRVSSNPHIRDNKTTAGIMMDVIISLIPASVFGVYNFGPRALEVIIVTVLSTVLTEYLYEKIFHKDITVGDFSAVVTGLLLALNLPVSIPLWIAVIGGVFAILIVKMAFGGLGCNFMNPALAARCFLLLSFTSQMTNFTYDAVTTATPLYNLKHGGDVNLYSMIIGTEPGTIGETSVIAILIGAAYLLVRRIIDYRIPVFYLGTFAIFAAIYSAATTGFNFNYVLMQLAGGGIMFGAVFMATDYVTSPITSKGRIVYGIILGLLTGTFRMLSSETAAAEFVSYSIIFANLLVPIIDAFTTTKPFGYVKPGKDSQGKEIKE